MEKDIVFLISQPRAGSTLLQAILGTHPDIYTCSEPWIALPFVYAMKEEGSEFDFIGSWSRSAIKAFFHESGIDEGFYNSALNSFLTSLYQKALGNSGKKLFLDKTPRYYEIASELVDIFPDAKFIVLYRNPLSVLNSILNTWVKENTDILYYYSRDLLAAPQKLTDFVSRHERKICLVNYEDLVKAPQGEIHRICEYLGVGYLEEIINYKSDQNWAFGDKNFRGKSAPDIKSIDAWKEQLTDRKYLNFSYYYLQELGESQFSSLGYNFAATLNYLKSLNPNEDDRKAWETLLHNDYISTVEEQRLRARDHLNESPFKALLRRLAQ